MRDIHEVMSFVHPKIVVNRVAVFLFFALSVLALLCPTKSFADFVRSPANPVLSPGASTDWDNAEVTSDAFIYENNTFKTWYVGNTSTWYGGRRQIGYADSPTGTNFSKYINNPVIPWNIISSSDFGVVGPSVIVNTDPAKP